MSDLIKTVYSQNFPIYEIDGKGAINNQIGAAIYRKQYPLTRSITQQIINHPVTNLAIAMGYALNTYEYGVPESYGFAGGAEVNTIKDIIEAEYGRPIIINFYYLGFPIADFFGRQYVQDEYGLELTDMSLTYPPMYVGEEEGGKCYYQNAKYVNGSTARIRIEYLIINQFDEYTTTYQYVDLPINREHTYYQVQYDFTDTAVRYNEYWAYDGQDPTYPDLVVPPGTAQNTSFLPIIPLRSESKNLGKGYDENGDLFFTPISNLYLTSVQLCRYLDIDYDGLSKSIHEDENIKDVDEAYIISAVELRSEVEEEQIYIYQFFKDLYEKDQASGDGLKTVEIKDIKYRIEISWDTLTFATVNGTITDKVETIFNDSANEMTIRYRISDTQYGVINVIGLEHRNYIISEVIRTTVADSAEEDNRHFLIPVRYDILKDRPLAKQMDLYNASLRLVMNQWNIYNPGFWEENLPVLVGFVAVVMAITTGVTTITNMYNLYAAAGMKAVFTYALQIAITQAVLKVGFEKLVEILGEEFALLAAVVLAFAGTVGTDAFGLDSMDLLELSTGIGNALSDIQQNSMKGLVAEMAELTEEYEALNDELSDLEDALDVSSYLEPTDFIWKPELFVAHETPTEYFNRKIHAGNIGVSTLNGPELFVESRLTLPKVNF